LIDEDAYVLRNQVEWVAAILISTGSFHSCVSKVAPGKPHSHPLRVVLCRSTDAMASPCKLRLLGTTVDAASPVPAFIGVTDFNLGPELQCPLAFSSKETVNVKRHTTFTGSGYTANTGLMAIKPH
jgi:hypothetical protein